MKATVSWRRIGDWVVELSKNDALLPILHLVDIERLQAELNHTWPACRVTYDDRAVASIVIREVPYEGFQQLVNYLAQAYPTHPITQDRIAWKSGSIIG